MTTIKVDTSKPGLLVTGGTKTIADTRFDCLDTSRAIAVKQVGGTLSITGCTVAGGHGPQIFGCDAFTWDRGGAARPVRKYPAGYIGDLLQGKRAKKVTLRNLVFGPGSCIEETILRCMGCDELFITDCVFDGTKQANAKEAMQIRHCKRAVITNCDILGSLVLGTLGPGEASPDSLDIYHRDAKQFRLNATFENCEVLGDVRITGQSDATFRKCRFTGPDPRGRSGGTCLNLRSFSTAYGTLKPTCVAESCLWTGWKVKAASGVVVK